MKIHENSRKQVLPGHENSKTNQPERRGCAPILWQQLIFLLTIQQEYFP